VKTTGDMEGVEVGRDVVLFSRRPFGQPPGSAFSYTVPAVPGRIHTLVNLAGSVGVEVRRDGPNTVVTVGRGVPRSADAEGVIRFGEEPPR
jgi:pSer/pThr/pTyr-binding forkhead associated (FHA) protein